MTPPKILILLAHPDLAQSRVATALQAAALALQSPQIECRDLYRLYPDYGIDVGTEQAALAAADLLVWLHPLHWYGMPALLKLWVDEVLQFGWAYGPGGTALRGKDLWLVSSTGGSAEDYSASGHHQHPINEFLLPQAQTARLCGMRFVPPMLLHGAHRADAATLHQHGLRFAQQLLNYPHWCEGFKYPSELPKVPADERPSSAEPSSAGGH
ncbi:NAD(P)H-dependent oxidoreductase [Paucibacter sp. AS339]|uniref:glutathione-regulated potassium-efflux system oxidoreductase KefF n=1 Tax=Paucibacter hankyongi TaxID=3133434 RepID=UPI0030A278A3